MQVGHCYLDSSCKCWISLESSGNMLHWNRAKVKNLFSYQYIAQVNEPPICYNPYIYHVCTVLCSHSCSVGAKSCKQLFKSIQLQCENKANEEQKSKTIHASVLSQFCFLLFLFFLDSLICSSSLGTSSLFPSLLRYHHHLLFFVAHIYMDKTKRIKLIQILRCIIPWPLFMILTLY